VAARARVWHGGGTGHGCHWWGSPSRWHDVAPASGKLSRSEAASQGSEREGSDSVHRTGKGGLFGQLGRSEGERSRGGPVRRAAGV
jgi:hypothetical protein